ncbi:hypothetical protein LZ32DRAFT_610686 [Colletotrichum eremochloae]|nr:hypothetical protein LZ32DRAFT_610686 [Colletotrichum eremochloae]
MPQRMPSIFPTPLPTPYYAMYLLINISPVPPGTGDSASTSLALPLFETQDTSDHFLIASTYPLHSTLLDTALLCNDVG